MSDKNYYKFHSQLALPFLESNKECLKKIFKVLESKFGLIKGSNQKFVDLGSGDGRVVIHAALQFEIDCFGIEINESLIKEANNNVKTLKEEKLYKKKALKKIHFEMADIFEQNLKDFDYIYLFSLPTMQDYLKHVFTRLKLGITIISYKYPLKILNSSLNLEFQLDHDIKAQKLSAFFYTKI